jgi:hypothetical protein
MADPIAWFRKEHPVFGCTRLKESVVVRILKPRLKRVMVNITDRQLRPNPGNPQGFELKAAQGPRRILDESLIDGDGDLLPGNQSPADEMGSEDFFYQILSHGSPPSNCVKR